MRLLNVETLRFSEYFTNRRRIPSYAIASHRWLRDETSFQEFELEPEQRNREVAGYLKVDYFAQFVREHLPHIKWLWIDTCCINKRDASELSEAIISMYRWYRDAEICLAYLSDVEKPSALDGFEQSLWFSRGWTLQELLAPRTVVFLSRHWEIIGHKGPTGRCKSGSSLASGPSLSKHLVNATGIPETVLNDIDKSQEFHTEEKLSWISRRDTTREEDMSYSLLGLFDVSMAILYGEGGRRARERLLAEIRSAVDSSTRNAFSPPAHAQQWQQQQQPPPTYQQSQSQQPSGPAMNPQIPLPMPTAQGANLSQSSSSAGWHRATRLNDYHTDYVLCVALSFDGMVIASGSRDGRIVMRELPPPHRVKRVLPVNSEVTAVAFDRRQSYLVSMSKDNVLRLWDYEQGLLFTQILAGPSPITMLRFSIRSPYVLCARENGSLGAWFWPHYKTWTYQIQAHNGMICCMTSSPLVALFAVGTRDGLIRLCNFTSRACVGTLAGHQGAVVSLDYSSDGLRLVSGSADDTFRVWDLTTMRQTYRWNGRGTGIQAVRVVPGGGVGSPLSIVAVARRVYKYRVSILKTEDFVTDATISTDGKVVAVGCRDSTVRLYRTDIPIDPRASEENQELLWIFKVQTAT